MLAEAIGIFGFVLLLLIVTIVAVRIYGWEAVWSGIVRSLFRR